MHWCVREQIKSNLAIMASHTTHASGDCPGGQSDPPVEPAVLRDVVRLNEAIALAQAQASIALARAQGPEVIGQMARNVAHEFNNLLTVLQNSVDLLRMPNLAAERRDRYLGAIEASTDRATRLTRQIQDLARSLAPKPVTTNLSTRLDQLARSNGFKRVSRSGDPHTAVTAHIDPAGFDAIIGVLAAAWRSAGRPADGLELVLEPANGPPHDTGWSSSETGWLAINFCLPSSAETNARPHLIANGLIAALPQRDDMAPEWLQALSFIGKSGGQLQAHALDNGALRLTLYLPRNLPVDAGPAHVMRGINA